MQKDEVIGPPLPADAVAVAIIAACKETKERPEDIARGVPATRARGYAVFALKQVYADIPHSRIARCCGCPRASADTFLPTLRVRREKGLCKWWSEAAFKRVIAAVDRYESTGKVR